MKLEPSMNCNCKMNLSNISNSKPIAQGRQVSFGDVYTEWDAKEKMYVTVETRLPSVPKEASVAKKMLTTLANFVKKLVKK